MDQKSWCRQQMKDPGDGAMAVERYSTLLIKWVPILLQNSKKFWKTSPFYRIPILSRKSCREKHSVFSKRKKENAYYLQQFRCFCENVSPFYRIPILSRAYCTRKSPRSWAGRRRSVSLLSCPVSQIHIEFCSKIEKCSVDFQRLQMTFRQWPEWFRVAQGYPKVAGYRNPGSN